MSDAPTAAAAPKMNAAEVTAFLDREFPQLLEGGRCIFVEAVEAERTILRLAAGERHLRPGGTVSGPTMMMLADVAAYAAVLTRIGPVALAVTTSFSINFLRRPAPGDLLAETRILKLGRQLAVIDCAIRAAGAPDLVAHAVATYSIPPARG